PEEHPPRQPRPAPQRRAAPPGAGLPAPGGRHPPATGALRRSAPARGDRPRPDPAARPGGPGRGGLCPGRDRAGPDPAAAGPPPGRTGTDLCVHLPRPCRGEAGRRHRLGAAPRPAGRAWPGHPGAAGPSARLHPPAAGRHPRRRPRPPRPGRPTRSEPPPRTGWPLRTEPPPRSRGDHRTMTRPRLGLFTRLLEEAPAADRYRFALEQISHAEQLGFASACVAQHHFGEHEGGLPSPFVLLAAAAQRTEQIGLGTAVVTLPIDDPLRAAEDAAVVDALSDGRVQLGIAAGGTPSSFPAFGRDPAARREL